MEALIEWFEDVSGIIEDLIDFGVDSVEDIFEMIEMVGKAAKDIPDILSFLPPPVVVILVSFLTAAILYKIIGREG